MSARAPVGVWRLPSAEEILGDEIRDFDLVDGVIMHGPIKLHAPSLLRSWKSHYVYVSKMYQAVFLWEGEKASLWENTSKLGNVRMIQFGNFRAVTWYPDTKGGRCFDVELIVGGKFRFQAYDAQDALDWAKCFSKVGAKAMAACRIQKIVRGFRARRAYNKLLAARRNAIDNVRRAAGTYEVLLEGVLRKRDASGVVSLWRQRYFELAPGRGELTYFESETRKKESRSIPFATFLKIEHDVVRAVPRARAPRPDRPRPQSGRRAKQFTLHCTSGRSYDLMAKTAGEAEEWVRALNGVLPRENVAAITIQRAWRRIRTWKSYKLLIAALKAEQGGGDSGGGGGSGSSGAGASKQPTPTRSARSASVDDSTTSRRSLVRRMAKHRRASVAAGEDEKGGRTSRVARLRQIRARKQSNAGEDGSEGVQKHESTRGWLLREATGGAQAWRRRFCLIPTGEPLLLYFRSEEDCAAFEHATARAAAGEADEAEVEAAEAAVMGQLELDQVVCAGRSQRDDLPPAAAGAVDVVTNERCFTFAVPAGDGGAGDRAGAWADAISAVLSVLPQPREAVEAAKRADDKWLPLRANDGEVFAFVHKFTLERKLGPAAARAVGGDPAGSAAGAAAADVEVVVEEPDPAWMEYADEATGRPYFMNRDTKEVTWTKPPPLRVERRQAAAEPGAAAAAADLPEGWRAVQDPTTGRTYFFNAKTQVRTWEKPAAANEPAAGAAAVGEEQQPAGTSGEEADEEHVDEGDDDEPEVEPTAWRAVLHQESGRHYFYNRDTKERTWTKPAELEEYERKVLEREQRMQERRAARALRDGGKSLPQLSADEVAEAFKWRSVLHEASGRHYYYNSDTKERTWTKPPNFDEARLQRRVEEVRAEREAALAEAAAKAAAAAPPAAAESAEPAPAPAIGSEAATAAAVEGPAGPTAAAHTAEDGAAGTHTADAGPAEAAEGSAATPAAAAAADADDGASPAVAAEGEVVGEADDGGAGERLAAVLLQRLADQAREDPVDKLSTSQVVTAARLLLHLFRVHAVAHGTPALEAAAEGDKGALFRAVADGTLLCRAINAAAPDTVDERALNEAGEGSGLSDDQVEENRRLCLNAVQAAGCVVPSEFAPEDFSSPSAPLLQLVWEVVLAIAYAPVSLRKRPELAALADEDEGVSVATLTSLQPRLILLRWCNHHLVNADAEPVATAEELASQPVLVATLLRQVAMEEEVIDEEAAMEEAEQLAQEAAEAPSVPESLARALERANADLSVPAVFEASDIGAGPSEQQVLAFLALLFDAAPGLRVAKEDVVEMDKLAEGEGDSRGARMFQMWINSLQLKDVVVHDLFESMRDGLALLKIMDAVQPGVVAWNKVNKRPNNKWRRLENLKYAIDVCQQDMELHLVNIGSVDVFNGNRKLILALMWQLMRRHLLEVLNSLNPEGGEAFDDDIIEWANTVVQTAAPPRAAGKLRVRASMRSFGDPSLGDGIFLTQLLSAVAPGRVNWAVVTEGNGGGDRRNNASYIISVARKLGCTVFLTWEDIVEVKPRMIMTLVASVMALSKKTKALEGC